MTAYVEHYPAQFRLLVNGEPDDASLVEAFQLRPGDENRLVEWAGGGIVTLINGGPAVILPHSVGVVGLGDYALRSGADMWAERADGFFNRYALVDD